MYFTSIPSLDFTPSSFGGLDLTTVPIAFSWLNDTAFWLLEEVGRLYHCYNPIEFASCVNVYIVTILN